MEQHLPLASYDERPPVTERALWERCAPGRKRLPWRAIAPVLTLSAGLSLLAPSAAEAATVEFAAGSLAQTVSEYGGPVVGVTLNFTSDAGDPGYGGCVVAGSVSVVGGSAGAGDFAFSDPTAFQVFDGISGTARVELTILDDAVTESTETIQLAINSTLTGVDGTCVGFMLNPSGTRAEITIQDDDPDTEAPSGGGAITLSGIPGQTVDTTLTVSDNLGDIAIAATTGTVSPTSVAGISGQVTYSFAVPAGATAGATLTDTITLTDSAQNQSQVAVTITVLDAQAPSVPATLDVSAAPGQTASGLVTVSDNLAGLTVSAATGTVAPTTIAGTSGQVTYSFPVPAGTAAGSSLTDTITVTDAAGNPAQVAVTITVLDGEAPTVPGTLTISGTPGETVTGSVAVSDNVAGITASATTGTVAPTTIAGTSGQLTYTLAIAAGATVGQAITDTITVTDGAQNSSPIAVTVNVIDQSAPQAPGQLTLTGAAGTTVSSAFTVTDDQAGVSVAAQSGTVAPTTIDATSGQVTYSRLIPAGTAAGQVLTDTITLTDPSENTNTVAVSVTVTDSTSPQTSGPLTLTGAPGQSATGTLTVSDDQSGISVSAETGAVAPSSVAGTEGQVTYTFPVSVEATSGQSFADTITVSDAAGNTVTVPVTVTATIADTSPPDPLDDLDVTSPAGESAATTFTVSDDQSGITIAAEQGTVDPAAIEGTSGTVTYTFPVPTGSASGAQFSDTVTVTDAAGNASTFTVTVTVVADGFETTPGLNETQLTIARTLDAGCAALAALGEGLTAAQQNLLASCNVLQELPDGQVGGVLDQIAPDEIAAQGSLAIEAANTQWNNIDARLNNVRGSGGGGVNLTGLNISVFGQPLPNVLISRLAPSVRGGGASADESGLLSKLGVFVNGNVRIGDKNNTDREPGFDFDTYGVTAGADYRFSESLVIGGALGYAATETEFSNSGGNVDFDSYSVSVYGTYFQSEKLYVDAIATVGRNAYDTKRRIQFANEDAKSDTDGMEYSVSVGAGYDASHGGFAFGPYARVNYVRTDVDGYRERPTASGLELELESQDIESVTTVLGGQVSYNLSTTFGVVSPQFRLEWEHEYKDDERDINGRLVNDPTATTFAVPTDNPDRDFFNVGVGVSAVFAAGRSAFVYYETELGRNDFKQHEVTAGIRLEF